MSKKLSITALSKEEIQKRIEEIRFRPCYDPADEIRDNGQIEALKWILQFYDTGYYEKFVPDKGLVVSGMETIE
jgi:hypothetical protein